MESPGRSGGRLRPHREERDRLRWEISRVIAENSPDSDTEEGILGKILPFLPEVVGHFLECGVREGPLRLLSKVIDSESVESRLVA